MDPQLQKRLKSCNRLPTPPTVAQKIVDLAQDPDINISSLADIITKDPALTAKLMRIANSSFYARARKCQNLRQALVMLGLNATVTLALTFSLSGVIKDADSQSIDLLYLWKRAMLSGVAATALARVLERRDSEELFLAALMQDIGVLALDAVEPTLYASEASACLSHNELEAIETSKLGCNHAEVGAWLLTQWRLPGDLVAGVGGSHNVAPVHGKLGEFIGCVALSGQLADIWQTDVADPDILGLSAHAEALLGIGHAQVNDVLETIGALIPEAEDIYGVELSSIGECEAILDSAKELLVLRNLKAIDEVHALQEKTTKLERQTLELEEKGRRDALTGVFNREHFTNTLETEFEFAVKQNCPLTVAFIDLDYFKLINDNFGHQFGDKVLTSCAQRINDAFRGTDIVARYGGDEFVVILPGTNDAAEIALRRVQSRIREARHKSPSGEYLTLSVSIGAATMFNGDEFASSEALLAKADEYVYLAKKLGRNQTVYNGQALDTPDAVAAAS